jgi:adenosine deaminase
VPAVPSDLSPDPPALGEAVTLPLLAGVRIPRLLGEAAKGPIQATALSETLRTIWRLPKVELHQHLEGSVRVETVSEVAAWHEPGSPFSRPGWHESHWTFTDLSGFAAQMAPVWRAAVRGPEGYYRVACECFEDLAAQNVVYAEPSITWPRGTDEDAAVLAVLEQARREAEARWPLRIGLIAGIRRTLRTPTGHPVPPPLEVVERVLRARDQGAGIVGIDLHGDEQISQDLAPFVEAYALAARGGLGLRAHAGEGAGAYVVRETVERLGVQRVGHGVRAIEDRALVAEIARRGVALDVCPTSNVAIGCAPSIEGHPIRAFMAAGVPVTVSSDDPLVFNTTVTAELALLRHQLGFSLAELGDLTRNAARHAFLPEEGRAQLLATINAAWPA